MIVMTLLVRDEEDILWENILYHRSVGVNHFIITDNLSVDGTSAIIEEAVKRGWATSIKEDEDNYNQAAWVTRMARLASTKHGADWVINSDADEFWVPHGGNLKEVFAKVPKDCGFITAERHDFAGEQSSSPWHERLRYRFSRSANALGRPLPPKIAHRGCPMVEVMQGNHGIRGLEHKDSNSGLIEILHFPIRSLDQYENKIRKGGQAYQRNTILSKHIGDVWRTLYAELQHHGTLRTHTSSHILDTKQLANSLNQGLLFEDNRLARLIPKLLAYDEGCLCA